MASNYSPDAEDDKKGQVVFNKPYDESVEVSDAEEVTSAQASPRDQPTQQEIQAKIRAAGYKEQHQQQQEEEDDEEMVQQTRATAAAGGGAAGQGGMYQNEPADEESEQSESESSEDGHATLTGAYDPAEFDHLPVAKDLKELFQHIRRYTPQNIELDLKLRPFIPDYIPAIGDIDAFIKVSRPDNKADTQLGKTILDEPKTKQSDPTVLDLQLRAIAKQPNVKPVAVHSISDPEKNSKAVDNWITSINELHRQKPAAKVHYTKNLPDIETLMQEWPPQFEDLLNNVELPSADLDCSLSQYVDIICNLLDIPVYKNKVHSLHVLFTLYMEFKNSQHFKSLATQSDDVVRKPRSDSVVTEAN